MAGTAKNQVATEILKGPCSVWINLAVPAAAGRLTLDADGTPDATANPTAWNVGLTVGGAKYSFKYSETSEEADELTAPFNKIISADNCTIQFEMWQSDNVNKLLQAFAPSGTYATGVGYEEIAFGGSLAIPAAAKPSVAIIGQRTSDPTKFFVVHLYSAINTAGLEGTFTKKNSMSIPITLEGQSVSTRAAGDQVGKIWHIIA